MFFFFQAEDGIRDLTVTGVQTCALPISWAPTTLAWGYDNRTCGFRIVGHGSALRAETRIPGADANPYLAFAALLAAGLYGIEEKLELGPGFEGNAYESDVQRFPHTLRDAIDA